MTPSALLTRAVAAAIAPVRYAKPDPKISGTLGAWGRANRGYDEANPPPIPTPPPTGPLPTVRQAQGKAAVAEHLRGTRLAMHLLHLKREFAGDREMQARLDAALQDRGLPNATDSNGTLYYGRGAEENWRRIGSLLQAHSHPWAKAYNWHRIGESLAVDKLVREFVKGVVRPDAAGDAKLFTKALRRFDPATGTAAQQRTGDGGDMTRFWGHLRNHVASKLGVVYHPAHFSEAALVRSLRRQAYKEQDEAEVAGQMPRATGVAVPPLVTRKPNVVKPQTHTASGYLSLLPGVGSAEQYRRGRLVRYSTHTHGAFHAAMRANRKDSLPPLVYADWLEEQGQHAHARVVRLHQQRVAASGEHATYAYFMDQHHRDVPRGVPIAGDWLGRNGQHLVSVGYADPESHSFSYHSAALPPQEAHALASQLEAEGVLDADLARVHIERTHGHVLDRPEKLSRPVRYAGLAEHVRGFLGLPTRADAIKNKWTHHMSDMTGGDALPAHTVETNREAAGRPGPVPRDVADKFVSGNRHRDTLRESLIAAGHPEREATRGVTPDALAAWKHNGIAAMMDSEAAAGRHGTARAIGVAGVRRLQEAGIVPFLVNHDVDGYDGEPIPLTLAPRRKRPKPAEYTPAIPPAQDLPPLKPTSKTARRRGEKELIRKFLEGFRSHAGDRAAKIAAAMTAAEANPPVDSRITRQKIAGIARAMKLRRRRGRRVRYSAGGDPDTHAAFQKAVREAFYETGDHLPSLVYADYLDELGNPRVADFIRRSAALGEEVGAPFGLDLNSPWNRGHVPGNQRVQSWWTGGPDNHIVLHLQVTRPYQGHGGPANYGSTGVGYVVRTHDPVEAHDILAGLEGEGVENARDYRQNFVPHLPDTHPASNFHAGAPEQYAAYRAPAGGMSYRGVFYPGGQTVPDVTKLAANEPKSVPYRPGMKPPAKRTPPPFDPFHPQAFPRAMAAALTRGRATPRLPAATRPAAQVPEAEVVGTFPGSQWPDLSKPFSPQPAGTTASEYTPGMAPPSPRTTPQPNEPPASARHVDYEEEQRQQAAHAAAMDQSRREQREREEAERSAHAFHTALAQAAPPPPTAAAVRNAPPAYTPPATPPKTPAPQPKPPTPIRSPRNRKTVVDAIRGMFTMRNPAREPARPRPRKK